VYLNEEIQCESSPEGFLCKKLKSAVLISNKIIFSVQPIDSVSFAIYTLEKHKKLVHKFASKSDVGEWIDSIRSFLYKDSKPIHKRHLAIFLNPNSGGKQGENIYKRLIPMLQVASFTHTLFVSKRAAHITEMAKEVKVSDFDGFVAMGGDGTLFELVQGLYSRQDLKDFIFKPIGIIPAGTGNGLGASAGIFSPEEAVFTISRGFYRSLDMAQVWQGEKVYWSFLSLSWAIIANVDLDGDSMRWMGSVRVPLNAIKCVLENKGFKAKLSYIVDPKPEEDHRCWNANCNDPLNGYNGMNFDNSIVKEHFGKTFKGTTTEDKTDAIEIKTDQDEKGTIEEKEEERKDFTVTTREDKFTYFLAQNVTHIATDTMSAPHSKLSDGCWDLAFVKYGKSRGELLKTLTAMDKIPNHKVVAFLLEPLEKGSYMDLDGEKLEYVSTLVQIHKGSARLFFNPKL
jgi:diacylglycerol kinase family enzyme